ncbi:MAG: site-specific DNA-methyltransferase [Bacteroidales bacterium]|nr:site-specific DNA-methyltransferase [Bacteroidales bacterium]
MAHKIERAVLAQRIRELDGLTNDERSALLELLNTEKRYGLVWENKPEDVEERLRENLPVLKEVKEKALTQGGADAPNHIIIEGDNFEALTALTYTHEGKIDVIYIDPPYNTGNKDFVYNDNYVDAEDGYRHSKWLSFMNRRLKIAKRLLSDKGVIFISIDDNEQANLKLLCDEVFGSNNYVNTISIKAKSSSGASGGGEDKKLKKNIEYLLLYAKQRADCDIVFPLTKCPLIELIQEKRESGSSWLYTNVMVDDGEKEFFGITKAGNGEDIKLYKVTNYCIKSINEIVREEGISEEEAYNKYIDKIFTTENAQTSIRQRVKDAVGENDDYFIAKYAPVSGRNKGQMIEVGFIGTTKRLISYLKTTCHIDHNKVYKLNKIGTLWDDLSWSAVSNEGGVPFPAGKKPIALMKRVINMIEKKDAIILDFFGGSASTAHAVMDLNSEDKGNRKSIIVTNNENKICENKSWPRLRNVILGYGNKAGLINNNLRYYKTDFIPRERTNTNMRALVKAATDLLCIKEDLYDEEKTLGSIRLKPSLARLFRKGDQQMLVIYREEVIFRIVEELEKLNFKEKLKVYLFAPGRYAFDDDFITVQDKVSLCALPAAIYDAYQKVLPKRKVKLLPEYEPQQNDELNFEEGREEQ